jgi:hypothetical protein
MLESGILLESNDHSLGHDFWEPGVYCTPKLETGRWYARPQILFQDEVFHRVVFELRVDPARRKKNRARGGIQWVFNSDAVSMYGLWVQVNAPPVKGEERVNEWDPALEALPPGEIMRDPIINDRQGPWPEVEDDDDDEEVWSAPHLGVEAPAPKVIFAWPNSAKSPSAIVSAAGWKTNGSSTGATPVLKPLLNWVPSGHTPDSWDGWGEDYGEAGMWSLDSFGGFDGAWDSWDSGESAWQSQAKLKPKVKPNGWHQQAAAKENGKPDAAPAKGPPRVVPPQGPPRVVPPPVRQKAALQSPGTADGTEPLAKRAKLDDATATVS